MLYKNVSWIVKLTTIKWNKDSSFSKVEVTMGIYSIIGKSIFFKEEIQVLPEIM